MNKIGAIKCLPSLSDYKQKVDNGITIMTYDAVDNADEDDILSVNLTEHRDSHTLNLGIS
jgi:hypothetical protein